MAGDRGEQRLRPCDRRGGGGSRRRLADETKGLGIKVLIVELGAFRTGLFASNSQSAPSETYADSVGQTRAMIQAGDGTQPGLVAGLFLLLPDEPDPAP